MKILSKISSPSEVKKFNLNQMKLLSFELREFIIDTILKSGGHFSSNLGVIELCVALFHTLDLNRDAIIWDVGHQSYPHKILTGRLHLLNTIRSMNGLSGFPKRDESLFDVFGTGHSSTAISAAMGMATAAQINPSAKIQPTFVAVVGDGALTAGMSYEALNNLFESKLNVLIILNDNHMGIDPNTGALNTQLQHNHPAVKQWFEWFGLKYSGPIDGHNLDELLPAVKAIYEQSGPRMLHVKTLKGKGYPPAEKEQTKWHSASKYVKIEHPNKPNIKWQDVFGDMLIHLAKKHSNLVGITPAMPSSCGMIKAMNVFPDRFFDVGIAEQHALTFAAGMATQNIIPIVNIYSSFLQRGYDQMIHDIALQSLPVILCIDRAGLVGEDGPTHHGAFDIAFLRCIPNLLMSAPRNASELFELITFGIQQKRPIAIRYPKGSIQDAHWENSNTETHKPIALTPQILRKGNGILLITTGHATNLTIEAIETFHKNSKHIQHIHVLMIHRNASVEIWPIISQFAKIVTVEDGCIAGGWGEGLASEFHAANPLQNKNFIHLGIPHQFIEHGNNEENLYELCGYSPSKIAEVLKTINEC